MISIQQLTEFFKWCTVINGGLLIFWSVFCMAAPNTVYKLQSIWFNISRENFDVLLYAFLGLFKIFFIVLNLTPYIALLILS